MALEESDVEQAKAYIKQLEELSPRGIVLFDWMLLVNSSFYFYLTFIYQKK